MSLWRWGSDLLAMIYPRLCEVCGRPLVAGERHICLHCRLDMPIVHISDFSFNELHRRMAAPGVPVCRAASMFTYTRGGDYARLIHAAKYYGRPVVARYLARELSASLMPAGFFEDMTDIVPVPIHFSKRLRRGFNQTEYIARGVADITSLPVNLKLLSMSRGHSTQTHKSVFERWLNTIDIYTADMDAVSPGSHILLVDDVMTTGATMLSCAEAVIRACPTVRISVLTLALTGN
ncbi:MAG: ComF family protein [Paramuribaculum sp.]|nr:ComF family protein [Paramuribaculum sp.]